MNRFYSREVRQQQIMRALTLCRMEGRPGQSMRQLARKVDMAPSNHLMGLLWGLVDLGWIIATPSDYRGPAGVRWAFEIAPHKYSEHLFLVYQESGSSVNQGAIAS